MCTVLSDAMSCVLSIWYTTHRKQWILERGHTDHVTLIPRVTWPITQGALCRCHGAPISQSSAYHVWGRYQEKYNQISSHKSTKRAIDIGVAILKDNVKSTICPCHVDVMNKKRRKHWTPQNVLETTIPDIHASSPQQVCVLPQFTAVVVQIRHAYF